MFELTPRIAAKYLVIVALLWDDIWCGHDSPSESFGFWNAMLTLKLSGKIPVSTIVLQINLDLYFF